MVSRLTGSLGPIYVNPVNDMPQVKRVTSGFVASAGIERFQTLMIISVLRDKIKNTCQSLKKNLCKQVDDKATCTLVSRNTLLIVPTDCNAHHWLLSNLWHAELALPDKTILDWHCQSPRLCTREMTCLNYAGCSSSTNMLLHLHQLSDYGLLFVLSFWVLTEN